MAPDDDDRLEPADHSGNPHAPRSADDLTHLRDESRREPGQTEAGRWLEGRWHPAITYTWRENADRDAAREEE